MYLLITQATSTQHKIIPTNLEIRPGLLPHQSDVLTIMLRELQKIKAK